MEIQSNTHQTYPFPKYKKSLNWWLATQTLIVCIRHNGAKLHGPNPDPLSLISLRIPPPAAAATVSVIFILLESAQK